MLKRIMMLVQIFFLKIFLSNNNVQDDGVRDILEGLINQVNEDKNGKGLSILILWNNRLTKKSSPYFSRIIVCIRNITNIFDILLLIMMIHIFLLMMHIF